MPKLTVRCADETTEIFVVAADFRLRARGARQLEEQLDAGVYKVRAVNGRSEWKQVVALREDLHIDVPRIAFGSAAPLAGTNRTHESHMAAAEEAIPPEAESPPAGAARSLGRAQDNHDATLVFMARWWTPWSGTGPQNLADPAKGATLSSSGGRRLMTLAGDAAAGPGPTKAGPRVSRYANWFSGDRAHDRFSGVSLRARSGLYTLNLSDGDGRIEQMVTLLPGWRTHIFALYEPPIETYGDTRDGTGKKLVDVAIHMTRGGLSMDDEIARLTDAARLALADERSTATKDLLNFARGKFQNPMLGLYSAHLLHLLKDKSSSASVSRTVIYEDALFNEIVDNTEHIFGVDHPDIIALRGQTSDDRPLTAPPMLWRGWQTLLAATAEHPDLVPPKIWRRTSLRSRSRPFFAWRVPQYGGDRVLQREIEITRAVLTSAEEWEATHPEAQGLRRGTAQPSSRDAFVRDAITRFEAPGSVIEMILG